MNRLRALVATFVLVAAAVTIATGCSAVRRVRDRITGDSTPGAPANTPTPKPPPTPVPTPTPALPPNPQGLARWDSLPVPYCISADGQGYVSHALFVEAVVRAFDTWGVFVRYTGECGPPTANDGVNEIGWGVLGRERGRVYEAGLTQTVISTCTSNCDPDDRVKLQEADITIDTQAPREFRTPVCLYATLLHETGHFLGLEHLPSPAVMQAETSGCPTELTDADRQALLARYGARANPQ